jgi:hypothetical protein
VEFSFDEKVHSSGIGGLRARLRNGLAAPISAEKREPTTGGALRLLEASRTFS